MAAACPQCGDPSQVLNLPAFWRGLPKETQLRYELAPPPAYTPSWLLVLALLALGAVSLAEELWLTGGLATVTGLGLGWWGWRCWREAEEARAAWQRSLYCRRCPRAFPLEDAKFL
jgi:hypothetical protein